MISKRKYGGFSLVELLVSIGISAVILAGVVGTMVTSKRTFLNEEEGSFMQENARYAIEVLTRDIRAAGYGGCAPPFRTSFSNVLADDLDGFIRTDNDSIVAIEGYIGTQAPSFLGSDVINTSDVVVVRYPDPQTAVSVKNHFIWTGLFEFYSPFTFETNDYLYVTEANCRNAGVFQATSVDNGARTLTHGGSASGGANNCSLIIKAADGALINCGLTPCDDNQCGSSIPLSSYAAGSSVMKLNVSAYYIGPSAVSPGTNALKRRYLTSAGNIVEELSQGVESMTMTYGIDEDADTLLDYFVAANEIPTDASGNKDWTTVVSVRFNIILRSQAFYYDTAQANPYDASATADRFLRKQINQTVRLRNR